MTSALRPLLAACLLTLLAATVEAKTNAGKVATETEQTALWR